MNFGNRTLAAFLGVMIRRMSRAAAVAGLVVFVGGRVYSGVAHGISAGSVLAIVLLLAFIAGVRGTFAYHRYGVESEHRTAAERR